MAKKKTYSRIYKYEGSKFRYNYQTNILENVFKDNLQWDEDKQDFIKMDKESTKLLEYEVITSQGLSLDNWKDSPEYWVEVFYNKIQEEVSYLY